MTDRPSELPTEAPGAHELDQALRRHLSSLADGDVGGEAGRSAAGATAGDWAAAGNSMDLALKAWRSDAGARAAWHRYQLIGDVLRSEDFARPADRDEAFLQRLRVRLEAEPTVLASPAAATAYPHPQIGASVKRRPRWLAPVALAASAALVAVGLLVNRSDADLMGPMASSSAPVSVVAGSAMQSGLGLQTVSTDGVLRDRRLDEFLRMHQMARGGLAVGVPGGTLQRADLQMPVEAPR